MIKNDNFEHIELLEELKDDFNFEDTSLQHQLKRKLEKIEEEVECELADDELNVEDVNYKNVLRLPYPKNLLYMVKFFKKYINSLEF